MLFLAVFCGFLAENFREHQVEHRREKQYIRSMIEDVKADTAHLSEIISDFKNITLALDTLNREFPLLNKGFSPPIFRNMVYLIGFEDLIPNDRTLQQLKNAGGMRLLRNEKVSDSIMQYDKKMKDLLIEQTFIGDLTIKFRNMGEIVDTRLWNGDNDTNLPKYVRENRDILITHDETVLSKYQMWMLVYQASAWNYLSELKQVRKYATRLINFMQEEYHLK
jgi:hypothetical protein